MPESQHRYLYERLGDHDFQQLVGALLMLQFPDYKPMPLRQADGGRDGLRRDEAGRWLVYQVKWSRDGKEHDPVSWLDATVKKEEDALRRLAAAGVRRYMLVTNVASTGKPETGTFDRVGDALEAHAKEYGFDDMACIWREALNPMVDNAPDQTKWAYAEMLAGVELVRYLVAEQVGGGKDKGTRDLIRRVAAAQWEDDKRIKFSQSDVDREKVADLFIDVTAERVHSPRERGVLFHFKNSLEPVGGAAKYLLRTAAPFVLVRGAPGQGKSTLSQFVCQAYRSAFMPEAERSDALPSVIDARFPVRADLSQYAEWLSGADPWDQATDARRWRTESRSGDKATLECFLADLMAHEGGDSAVTASDVHAVFQRVPSIVVLDGLDEVGRVTTRGRVVREIDKFVARGKTYDYPPRVVVTTRPSAGELPEPSQEIFEVLALNQLTSEQRASYLRKWCVARGITSHEGRVLRASFQERSREPYIGELAGNPMQLTILLDLIHEQGAATPTQRTDLYDKYVDLLLAREANKHPKAVRDHKEELLEIIPFLGWYLQAHTEESQVDSSMNVADLKEAMRHHQRTYGNPETVVDELFEGASDRLWALTSKIDGRYEFEVLSMREYFAARYLYRYAGEENPGFDRSEVLRELLRRPYWLNTVRFYGGNAKGSDVYTVVAGVEDELRSTQSAASYLAAWALLTDGVFLRRPRQARQVLAALCSDKGLPTLVSALRRGDITALPALPGLPSEDGPDPTWVRLTTLIASDPRDPANDIRVPALRELLNLRGKFGAWWNERLRDARGTTQQDAWLALGASCRAGAGTTAAFDQMDLSDGAAETLLSTGLAPKPGGKLEADLLGKILDGECAHVTAVRSTPARIAVALSPRAFYTDNARGFEDDGPRTGRLRTDAVAQLVRDGSVYGKIARERNFRAGQLGSTFPWANTATALFEHVGRCWLACEIAIIGAASPFNLAYSKKVDSTAFGATGHPVELLVQSRTNADNADWWQRQIDHCLDDLDRSVWALALWAVAGPDTLSALLPAFEKVLGDLPTARRRTVVRAAGQLADYGWLLKRPISADAADPAVADLVTRRMTPAGPEMADRFDAPLPAHPGPHQASLLSVARERHWLKVDSAAMYR